MKIGLTHTGTFKCPFPGLRPDPPTQRVVHSPDLWEHAYWWNLVGPHLIFGCFLRSCCWGARIKSKIKRSGKITCLCSIFQHLTPATGRSIFMIPAPLPRWTQGLQNCFPPHSSHLGTQCGQVRLPKPVILKWWKLWQHPMGWRMALYSCPWGGRRWIDFCSSFWSRKGTSCSCHGPKHPTFDWSVGCWQGLFFIYPRIGCSWRWGEGSSISSALCTRWWSCRCHRCTAPSLLDLPYSIRSIIIGNQRFYNQFWWLIDSGISSNNKGSKLIKIKLKLQLQHLSFFFFPFPFRYGSSSLKVTRSGAGYGASYMIESAIFAAK